MNTENYKANLEKAKAWIVGANVELQELRRVCKPLDGKIFDRRITSYIKEKTEFNAYIYGEGSRKTICISDKREYPFSASDMYRSRCYEITNELYHRGVYSDDLVKDKRFNYSVFEKHIIDKIQANRKKVSDIERDLLDGLQRLAELERAEAYCRQIKSSFGVITRRLYDF